MDLKINGTTLERTNSNSSPHLGPKVNKHTGQTTAFVQTKPSQTKLNQRPLSALLCLQRDARATNPINMSKADKHQLG